VWRSLDGATFDVAGTLPNNVMSATAVVHDREIWVLGGYDGSDLASSYASSDGATWVRKDDIPTARHEATAYDRGDLYVVGGHDTTGHLRASANRPRVHGRPSG